VEALVEILFAFGSSPAREPESAPGYSSASPDDERDQQLDEERLSEVDRAFAAAIANVVGLAAQPVGDARGRMDMQRNANTFAVVRGCRQP